MRSIWNRFVYDVVGGFYVLGVLASMSVRALADHVRELWRGKPKDKGDQAEEQAE